MKRSEISEGGAGHFRLDIELLRRMVDGSNLAMQVYRLEDPNDLGSFRFLETNRAAARHAGVPYEVLRADLGKTLRAFVPGILESEAPARYKRVLDSGQPESWDLTYGDAKYPVAVLRVYAWPLDARTIAVAFTNVTAERETQRQLDENITALRLAYHELEESRSRKAQVEKLASLGQMSAGIAHELNNPLLVVKGYCDQLRGLLNREELRQRDAVDKFLGRIERSCARIELIANRMSAYSRLSNREAIPLQVNQAIEEVAEMLRPQGKCEIVLSLSSDGPQIRGNPLRLEQLLVNLVLNARDAIADVRGRAGLIEIASERVDRKVQIRVRDNGTGVSDEVKAKMFDPFFSTKPPGAGTGLGLSIVHEIAQELRGHLDCETRLGEGTTFTLTVEQVEG